MSETDELEEALRKLWLGGRPPSSGQGAAIAAALEARYDVRLPEDFRHYVIEAAPAEDWMDSSAISLWAADRIVSLSNATSAPGLGDPVNMEIEAEADRYLVFACFADWCGYAYAVCCSDGANRGKVAMVGMSPSPDRLVTRNLASFIRLVAEDSMRIHSPGGDHYTNIV